MAVRERGKPVYGWLEAPGNSLVWLASACDRVWMVPSGELGLVGIGVELTFFGAALSRLGIRPDFEAAGAYKSFGEPFTRSYPSPANQEAVRELVDDLHEQLVQGIAEGRSRPVEEVRAWLSRAPLSAEQAREAGLVDDLLYEDQLDDWIHERHGKKVRRVAFARWAALDAARQRLAELGRTGPVISVLHLQGPIVVEDQGRGPSIASRKVVPILERLRKDDRVGAVVLHVDSGGGSALASDLLWREVDQLRKLKPVVASFEGVAASGGFYLAAPANVILARPGTLTGSIGVFGGKLVMGEGLRRVGVHTQEVSAAPNATLFSASHPFSPEQRGRFRASLQRLYDGFVARVAAGRGKPAEDVEPYCRGRVWTGRAALERQLVDGEGDLDAAIERARQLAGFSGPWVRRDLLGHDVPLLGKLFQGLFRRVAPSMGLTARAVALAERVWGPGAELAELVVEHPNQPLAMLPFEVKVR
jgi:protease-4